MKNIIYILIALSSFSSCVSLKPAKNIDKAENKIIKYNEGIKNQIKRFPSLIKNAYTYIEKDTILIKADTIEVHIPLQEIDSIEAIQREYELAFQNLENSLKSSTSYSSKQSEVNKRLTKKYLSQLDSLFSLYKRATKLNNKVGKFENDKFLVDYVISNGDIKLDIKTKDKYQIVDKTVTTNQIDIRKRFYQDIWFWWFCLGLIVLLYFIGETLSKALKEGINGIIKFIRKLILKI